MKQSVVLLFLCTVITFFTYCGGAKKAQAIPPPPAKITYEANLKPIIMGKCSPCHIPGQGNKQPYVTAAATSTDIDEIITRIELHPGERGFMPMKHERLSDSTISLFRQWKVDGLLEK